MQKIPVKGAAGLIFALGVMLILLIGVPPLRWFAAISFVLGLLIGIALLVWHKRRPKSEVESDSLKLG